MSARFTQVGRSAPWQCGRTGPIGLPAASCRRSRRSGLKAERNVVVTMWDWADPKAYLHDEIASDKRNPVVNPNGPIYGALEASADYMPVVDPVTHTATQIKLKVRDPKTPSEADTPPAKPRLGEEAIWTSQSNAHSFAMDKQARVWIAARFVPTRRRHSVARDRIILPQRRFQSIRADARCRCATRRRRK